MNKDIEKFADKYIDFFEKEFGRTRESYYRFFDNNDFPNDCQEIGFDMDCGQTFIDAYGERAWNDIQCLKDNIEKINDIQIIGKHGLVHCLRDRQSVVIPNNSVWKNNLWGLLISVRIWVLPCLRIYSLAVGVCTLSIKWNH